MKVLRGFLEYLFLHYFLALLDQYARLQGLYLDFLIRSQLEKFNFESPRYELAFIFEEAQLIVVVGPKVEVFDRLYALKFVGVPKTDLSISRARDHL